MKTNHSIKKPPVARPAGITDAQEDGNTPEISPTAIARNSRTRINRVDRLELIAQAAQRVAQRRAFAERTEYDNDLEGEIEMDGLLNANRYF